MTAGTISTGITASGVQGRGVAGPLADLAALISIGLPGVPGRRSIAGRAVFVAVLKGFEHEGAPSDGGADGEAAVAQVEADDGGGRAVGVTDIVAQRRDAGGHAVQV